jgi:hypothetical protein
MDWRKCRGVYTFIVNKDNEDIERKQTFEVGVSHIDSRALMADC